MLEIFKSKRKLQDTIDAQAEMIDNMYETLSEKEEERSKARNMAAKLERELLITEAELGKANEKLAKKSKPGVKRKQLAHRTGYTRVTDVESHDIFTMYKHGRELVDIANHFKRSQSCVSRHIRLHLED